MSRCGGLRTQRAEQRVHGRGSEDVTLVRGGRRRRLGDARATACAACRSRYDRRDRRAAQGEEPRDGTPRCPTRSGHHGRFSLEIEHWRLEDSILYR